MLRKILPPTECPSCGGELTSVNDLYYCYGTNCPAQKQRKIEHFAKTLKIKGLGPATIEKLEIEDFDQIYLYDAGVFQLNINRSNLFLSVFA